MGLAVAYWLRPGYDEGRDVVRSCLRCSALLLSLLFSSGAGMAQSAPPEPGPFPARVKEVARGLRDHPRLKELTEQEREEAVGSEFPIPCSDETIPCSANNRESPRKLLKLLNDSPPLREQGIPCRRLKLLDELTPTSAERTGNFANSLLFSLLSGNLEPEVGSCRRQGNADDGNARPLHHRTTGRRAGEA